MFVCGALVLLSCVKKTKEEAAKLTVGAVSGNVNIVRNNIPVPVQKDSWVQSGDVVVADKNSRAAIIAGTGRVIYINESTAARLDYSVDVQNPDVTVAVTLEYGETFSAYDASSNSAAAYSVITPNVSVNSKKSSFGVSHFPDRTITMVRLFNEQAELVTSNQQSITLAACNKIIIKSDGTFSNIISLTEKDIEELKTWVDNERVASIAAASQCVGEKEEKADLPPQWEGVPKKRCKPKASFTDKVAAKDPEGAGVRYFLIKGPEGMTVSENDGVIRYTPQSPGTYDIQISAEDEAGNASQLSYYLTVVGRFNAVVRAPDRVKADETFIIDASGSVNSAGGTEGLLFRFDCNGDGVWDYPGTGEFGEAASVEHVYKTAGVYTLKVEVKDNEGNTGKPTRTIEVTAPPRIQIVYSPLHGTPGTEFVIAVKQTVAKADPAKRLLVRWDLNGDGRWDYPSDGSFAEESEVRNLWDAPGTYTVAAEAEDESKNRVLVSAEIPVYRGITIEKLDGPDTVNVNDKIAYACVASDPDYRITEYAWDLAGTGVFSQKSAKPTAKFSYKEAGIYTLVCAVTNEKGLSASESKSIVVLNFTTTVDAGGPYTTTVNVPVSVEGLAKDVDNKVTAYCWDFDNDGTFERESAAISKAEHLFSRSGKYTIRFRAKTDDGGASEDTALVTVINQPPKASAGDDIVSRDGKKVKLRGMGSDPDKNIAEYAWDFNGDGTFDWSSKDTGHTVHPFTEYAQAVFRVTDAEGAFATDTVRIIICPKGMVTVAEGKFCIDVYEWPNEKGKMPATSVTYQEAVAQCSKAGKRLCSVKEMESACQAGKKRNDYPYGKYFVADNCNTYGNRHTDNRVAPSGEFVTCVNELGIYDMSGNVAEWTSTGEGDYKYVAGGWWQADEIRSTCSSCTPLKKNQKYFYAGFRCCK